MKHTPVSVMDVFAWLSANHPALFASAALERNWVWLVGVDLRGDQNKAVRESIKAFGFKFKAEGDHVLPDGRKSRWAHACQHPMKRKFKGKPGYARRSAAPVPAIPAEQINNAAELLDALF